MIEYLKGEITELDPTMAVIECHGVGYACAISVYTYDHLKKGQVQKIYVSESIREDAHLLYGFSSKQERELYELLITVSGVGPNTARCILSSLSPDELVAVVSSGNDRQLKNVKGIGTKTGLKRAHRQQREWRRGNPGTHGFGVSAGQCAEGYQQAACQGSYNVSTGPHQGWTSHDVTLAILLAIRHLTNLFYHLIVDRDLPGFGQFFF